ncbi:hypothetical protein [Rhizobium ruizarguesonis]|uniref:hypothetical protein n=1 Tax=Rhizobium ruizarguesonis TaxID=2081791 RepID=UPI001583AC58|nr:hypothetical protein [Rhizobium ruizarguesonis]
MQDWQIFWGDQDFDASGDAGLASDQAGAFERNNHLMNRGRGDLEMPLLKYF